MMTCSPAQSQMFAIDELSVVAGCEKVCIAAKLIANELQS